MLGIEREKERQREIGRERDSIELNREKEKERERSDKNGKIQREIEKKIDIGDIEQIENKRELENIFRKAI